MQSEPQDMKRSTAVIILVIIAIVLIAGAVYLLF
jgi:flagellar basal body-associated protein FliL